MNKKGFTLVELLVVIVIIGILSIIVVPSVMNINKNVNNRLYEEKTENIVSAAVLYANNHEELFNGTTEAVVYVQTLVDEGMFTADIKNPNGGACPAQTQLKNSTQPAVPNKNGCVIDPRSLDNENEKNMNQYYVILTKDGASVVGKYIGSGDTDSSLDPSIGGSRTLVDAVCEKFDKTPGKAYVNGHVVSCKCNPAHNGFDGDASGAKACLFSGTSPDNYLKYGDSKANWRVLGVYDISEPNKVPELAAKMITSDPI